MSSAPEDAGVQRKYSLAEIDAMRSMVDRLNPAFSTYTQSERNQTIERHLRTLMLNGTRPEELQSELNARYAIEQARSSRMSAVGNKCPSCGEAFIGGSGPASNNMQYRYKCGGAALIFDDGTEATIRSSWCGKDDTTNTTTDTPLPRGVTRWEHGFETDLVRASSQRHLHMGFIVAFSLPQHPHECDRSDMIEWLRSKGVGVYQCGGHAGAEIIAKVRDVTNNKEANAWLPAFLVEFDSWIRDNLGRRSTPHPFSSGNGAATDGMNELPCVLAALMATVFILLIFAAIKH